MDRLHWKPGWIETPDAEFRGKVQAAMDQNPEGWVIDGNYQRAMGGIRGLVSTNATDIICASLPLGVYF